ncbi:MAG: hypothetical protein MUD03_09760 [Pirellula sp.]|nr:hypothetical protein [Pirellula sp.]
MELELLTKVIIVPHHSPMDRRISSRPMARCLRICFALLFAGLSWASLSSVGCLGQDTGLMPMPPTDELLQSLPEGLRPDLVLLKNEKGESILVPKVRYEEFERFLKASSDLTNESQAVLETLHLDVRIVGGIAEFRGTAKARLATPNRRWSSLPLSLGALQILPPEDNSPFTIGLASATTGYQWKLEPSEALERTLAFRAVANVQSTVQSNQIRIDLPLATSVVDLHLPEGEWDLNVTGAGTEVVEPIPGSAPFANYRVRASGGSIDLVWSRRAASDSVQATEAVSITKFTQTPGSSRFDANSRITLRGPKRLGGRQFHIKLPAGGRLRESTSEVPSVTGYRLSTAGIQEDGVQAISLIIDDAVSRLELEFPLDWIWEAPKVEADTLFSVPQIEGVERHTGTAELILPRTRTLLWDSQPGVEFNKRTVAPESSELLQHSFRILNQSTSLRCRLLEPQITPSIRMDYRVWLFPDRWQLTGTIEFRDDPRGFPFLQLESKGWDVERVTVVSTGRDLAFTDAEANAGNNTIVPLSQSDWGDSTEASNGTAPATTGTDSANLRRIQIRMSLKHHSALSGPTTESTSQVSGSKMGFDLPLLTWLNESSQQRSSWSPSGNLSVFSSLASLVPLSVQEDSLRYSLSAVTTQVAELALRDARIVNPREGLPRYSVGLQVRGDKSSSRSEFLATPLQPVIEGGSTLRATATEKAWKVEQDWLLQIRGTFPDHLLLAIPKTWLLESESVNLASAVDLNVNGVAITEVKPLGETEVTMWYAKYPSLKEHVVWTRIAIPQQVYLTATGDFTWLVTLSSLRPPSRNEQETASFQQVFAHLESANPKAPIRYSPPVGLIQSRPSERVLLNSAVISRSQSEIRVGDDLWSQTRLTLPFDSPMIDLTLVPVQNQLSHAVSVDRVWVQTITKPGTNRHRFVVKFRTSRPTLEIQLDESLSQDIDAMLNQAPCELSLMESGKSRYKIDLSSAPRLPTEGSESNVEQENSYVLELFSWPDSKPFWWKRINLPKMKIDDSNIDRAPCIWQIVTPSSEHLLTTSEALLPDYRWNWNQLWLARQDSKSQSELEREMGASVQPDVGIQVNQYSLVALDTQDFAQATFVPRFLIWTPLALLTLALSSLLFKAGRNRNVFAVVAAVPLLAALVSWSVDITILVTQSMVVACAILLVYAFVEWILDRNARKKSVFAGRGTVAGSISGSRMEARSEPPSGSVSKGVPTTISPGADLLSAGSRSDDPSGQGHRP